MSKTSAWLAFFLFLFIVFWALSGVAIDKVLETSN